MGVLLALAAGLFFGASNITIRQGQIQGEMDQATGLFIGLLVNNALNLVVLGTLSLAGFRPPPLSGAAVAFFAAAGILTSLAGRRLLFSGIRAVGPSRAVALKITAPLFAILLGVLLLQERLAGFSSLGVAAVLAGTCLVSWEAPPVPPSPAGTREYPGAPAGTARFRRGVLLALAAGLALGTGSVFRKLGLIYYPHPVMGVAVSSLSALVVMLFIFALRGRLGEELRAAPDLLRGGYLWTGLFTSLAVYAAYAALLRSPVSIVNSVKAAEPFFTILGSSLFLRSYEVITARFAAASVVIILGVVILVLTG